TLIVVQLASGQLTPRIIALVLTAPGVKLVLAALTFTFTYTLAALGRIEDQVPHFHVSVAIILNLLCIMGFFRFVQQLAAGLRPISVLLLVAGRAEDVIDQVYPVRYDPKYPEVPTTVPRPTASAQMFEFVGRPGVIMAFSLSGLVRLAQEADATIELIPQV